MTGHPGAFDQWRRPRPYRPLYRRAGTASFPDAGFFAAGLFDSGLFDSGLFDPGLADAALPSTASRPAATSTGTWTTTGSLNTPRVEHTATLLQNGHVLVAGGQDSNYNYLASAELYTP